MFFRDSEPSYDQNSRHWTSWENIMQEVGASSLFCRTLLFKIPLHSLQYDSMAFILLEVALGTWRKKQLHQVCPLNWNFRNTCKSWNSNAPFRSWMCTESVFCSCTIHTIPMIVAVLFLHLGAVLLDYRNMILKAAQFLWISCNPTYVDILDMWSWKPLGRNHTQTIRWLPIHSFRNVRSIDVYRLARKW